MLPKAETGTEQVLGSPDARDVLVRWERELGSKASQSPPVTPRKWATPEAGGPTLGREPSKVGFAIGVKS